MWPAKPTALARGCPRFCCLRWLMYNDNNNETHGKTHPDNNAYCRHIGYLAAFIHSYLANGVMPSAVLKYIASGIFGSSEYMGGAAMPIIGLAVHYAIALSCTACFFWLYPKWPLLRKNILLNSVLIAVVAWVVTTQMIIPLSRAAQGNVNLYNALIAIGILFICVGLPIACSAKQYFRQTLIC